MEFGKSTTQKKKNEVRIFLKRRKIKTKKEKKDKNRKEKTFRKLLVFLKSKEE